MNFHVLTLFPEMVLNGVNTSITGRAVESGAISVEAVNIRDFTTDKHKKVDDYPYGGGAGMLMQAQPIYDAYKSVVDNIPNDHKKRVIYVTPQGHTFNQSMAEKFAKILNVTAEYLLGESESQDKIVNLPQEIIDNINQNKNIQLLNSYLSSLDFFFEKKIYIDGK